MKIMCFIYFTFLLRRSKKYLDFCYRVWFKKKTVSERLNSAGGLVLHISMNS